jgi:RNA polymerase sigma-70 factor (ECF subfamily)
MKPTDRELMKRMAAGNEAAFADFYDRHAPRILGLLLHWLKERRDAEDSLQEIFWEVWRRAGQYDPQRGSPLAWLFPIARSRAFDLLRKRRPELLAKGGPEPVAWDDPSDGLTRNETNRRVRKALDRLPEEQRRAIVHAFFTGLTYEEVAVRESIPSGTAKTRIRLGLRRLRQQLGEHWEY